MQISVHPENDMDSVYKFIPKEYFASDMGGNAPSFEAKKGIIYITYYILTVTYLHKINNNNKKKYASKKSYAQFKKLIL